MTDGGEGEVIIRHHHLEDMGSEEGSRGGEENRVMMEVEGGGVGGGEMSTSTPYYLDKFTLFETSSNFYMIGRDKRRQRWRVLKIGRLEPSELLIYEDPTIYSYRQCKALLEDVNEGNKLTGGRKFVTDCYGIVGFVKFLGPYYILLITQRKEIGQICGHTVYGVSEYKMIPIPQSIVWSGTDNSQRENRYKKLLWLVDIRKEFFFCYSYPIMHTLQKNMSRGDAGRLSDGTMFVWNEYLTHQIRNHLKNTLWTVALVHGFFKQVELSSGGKNFLLTLIARRSRQFAGTRFQKRGVNKEGQAANDVEIEQIVSQECLGDNPCKITSVVQNRGSIPLCWSQKSSLWNLKPEVILSEGDNTYEATQLHFQNLRLRYGDPIVPLSLIKTCERNRREYLLHQEFHKAVDAISMDLADGLLSLDLDAEFRRKGADVLTVLKEVAARAQMKIGLFSCQSSHPINFKASHDLSYQRVITNCAHSQDFECSDCNFIIKKQNGIFRTNCIDSLDRTNFAQYVYSLVALGHQLSTLEITEPYEQAFGDTLMSIYEALGDALAQQYGGSAAHSKIFSKTRGQCKAATKFQELMKSIQRHINNSFMDYDKQQAIDIFLGQFQPEVGESAPLKSNLNVKYNTGRHKAVYMKKISGFRSKRSQSDSNIDYVSSPALGEKYEISSSETDLSGYRCTPYMSSARLMTDYEKHWYGGLPKHTDQVHPLSFTEFFDDSGHDELDDGWCIVDSPASSSSG